MTVNGRVKTNSERGNTDPHQRVVKAGEAIRRKRPGLLRRGVVLQHDNGTPHSANLTQQWLQRYGWEILPHPAHSPDLAPSDFHLFRPLKRHLGGMAFETEDDLISELRNWFDNLDVDFFRVYCVHDVTSIYRVPLLLQDQSADNFLIKRLKLPVSVKTDKSSYLMSRWKELANKCLKHSILIDIVFGFSDCN
ncbi:histone-lysine N-methyltransferase SETMAR [Plakobranchus ocellatus]|uniref:Histone-lysine N-methyltransferase SETMAR n=1 Tax=Plakobranchus ocellatus TaxID=259542 RepID=A0AAV3Z5W3_9GAST|nr:histone-lysine N-methyltransferase SETMAR [Plakobranchus ocellatus]